MQPLRVFIGYDSREPIALSVCAHSINRRASAPVSIIPLNVNHLRGLYTRGPNGTTEFSLTRFLVPYLSNYEGVSIFMDCDMVVLTDIYELIEATKLVDRANRGFSAVYCCKHEYTPKDVVKATGVQTSYPRKNWSSVMVFDNKRCKSLTPEYVNTASPADLHRMVWAEERIGALSWEWNWLVSEYDPNPNAKILHFTNGTPCFSGYANSDHADQWFSEYLDMETPSVAGALAMLRSAGVA